MPTDNTEASTIESADALRAALEMDAGLAEWVFQELSAYQVEGFDHPLLDYVRKSDVHQYIDFIVRIGGHWRGERSMRQEHMGFKLQAKKIGCPQYGRFSAGTNDERFPRGGRG